MRSHIAILKRKYLNLILTGQKSLECRLTRTPCPPFDCIAPGETVHLKESSGPVRAQAVVDHVLFFRDLTPEDIRKIYRDYDDQIRAETDFWQSRLDCQYCTLVWFRDIEKIKPYRIQRKGMRAWIVCEHNILDTYSFSKDASLPNTAANGRDAP